MVLGTDTSIAYLGYTLWGLLEFHRTDLASFFIAFPVGIEAFGASHASTLGFVVAAYWCFQLKVAAIQFHQSTGLQDVNFHRQAKIFILQLRTAELFVLNFLTFY